MTRPSESPATPQGSDLANDFVRERLDRELHAARALISHRRFELILASSSPRRRQVLGLLLPQYELVSPAVAEVPRSGETPAAFAARAAREKAEAVSVHRPSRWTLGADTVVTIDGAIFGKPVNREEAMRMLQTLSGQTHRVLTAIAVAVTGATIDQQVVESEVTFRHIERSEIEAYVAGGEPFDKAGAYGIQGGAGQFATAVAGSCSNVIGLPLVELAALLVRLQETRR